MEDIGISLKKRNTTCGICTFCGLIAPSLRGESKIAAAMTNVVNMPQEIAIFFSADRCAALSIAQFFGQRVAHIRATKTRQYSRI